MEGEEQSDTETLSYDDEDIDPSDDQINEINWRYLFDENLKTIKENRLTHGAQPLSYSNELEIRIPNLFDYPIKLPFNDGLCSRLICDYGEPLSLSNKHQFYGSKIVNSAWQINGNLFEFPVSFLNSIQTMTFKQLHLEHENFHEYFEIQFEKLLIFGQCKQTKLYNFDRELFIYHATILVFLPSKYLGGQYRFIDDNENLHRYIFSRDSNDFNCYILIIPSDCEHEIQSISQGYNLLLVYHLISKTNSIHDLYSCLARTPTDSLLSIEQIFLKQRLEHLLNYWKTNLSKLANKLLIPVQHYLDYSSYYTFLFRQNYRLFLDSLLSIFQSTNSFVIYSSYLYYEQTLVNNSLIDSRLFIRNFHRLNSRNLDFNDENYERTVVSNEFLGNIQSYLDTFEEGTSKEIILNNNKKILRNDLHYHVLVVLPIEYQWDLFLDNLPNAYHHLSYMLSLNIFNEKCLEYFQCLLLKQTNQFEYLIEYLLILIDRFGRTKTINEFIRMIFSNKEYQNEFFSTKKFFPFINRLILIDEFFSFFCQILSQSIPIKLNEIIEFLLEIHDQTYRTLFIHYLLRFIFRKHFYPYQILFSTLCSIFNLLILDQSYSIDCLLTLISYLIKRVRKLSSITDIIEKYFKIHFIPMIIQIYRYYHSNKQLQLPSAFFFLYQFCLNTLEYYSTLPIQTNIIRSKTETIFICPCLSCFRFKQFLLDSNQLIYSPTRLQSCFEHTLQQFQNLSIEYHNQSLTITKCGYQQEFKQLCLHLRHILLHLNRL